MDCYIYYKSKEEHTMEIRHCVKSLRSHLSKQLGHQPLLQRRPSINNELITWMEIYRDVPENFEHILDLAVAKCGISALIQGERRLEYFVNIQD